MDGNGAVPQGNDGAWRIWCGGAAAVAVFAGIFDVEGKGHAGRLSVEQRQKRSIRKSVEIRH
jgi:hypothetical protein